MRKFNGICLITENVPALREFYQRVLEEPGEGDEYFGALAAERTGLTFFTVRGMEDMAPGSMQAAGSGRCVLEFWVDDVDQEYQRIKAMGVPIVKMPATYPWGQRSFWFRDPDGNIVNFHKVVGGDE